MGNFVGHTLQGNDPVSAAIIRKLSLETLYAGNREIVDGPDLHLLAVGFIAARIGPDIAANEKCAVPRLFAGPGHAAYSVVAVFAVIGENRKLCMFAGGVCDQLLADQEVALGRPSAIDIGGHLSGFAEGSIEERAFAVPFAYEHAKFPGGRLFVSGTGLRQGERLDRNSENKDEDS